MAEPKADHRHRAKDTQNRANTLAQPEEAGLETQHLCNLLNCPLLLELSVEPVDIIPNAKG